MESALLENADATVNIEPAPGQIEDAPVQIEDAPVWASPGSVDTSKRPLIMGSEVL